MKTSIDSENHLLGRVTELIPSFHQNTLATNIRLATKLGQEFPIDILSLYTTREVMSAILEDRELGIEIVGRFMLEAENNQYRGGEYPSIAAKILAILAPNGAEAKDFDGNPVRTKETLEQLAEMVKISEIDELISEIDTWFSTKKIALKEYQLLERVIQGYSNLLVNANIVDTEIEEHQTLIGEFAQLIESKKNSAHSLIAEVVDLHYNLIQLMSIDPKGRSIYIHWINQINIALAWEPEQSFALVAAKYHYRIYKSNGKNNFHNEDEEIGHLVNLPNESDDTKLPFPSNKQITQLFNVINRMRLVRPIGNSEAEQEVSLMRYFMDLKYQHESKRRIQHMVVNQPDTGKYLLDM